MSTNLLHLLAHKDNRVMTVGVDATALDAAVLMNDHKIGALVVTENRRVIGMFTERDVLRRIVAERRDPATVHVGEVMTDDVVCATPETSLEEARVVMKTRRIRHLPIVDDARHLLGIISIGDLNAWLVDGHEKTIHYLHEYIYGRS